MTLQNGFFTAQFHQVIEVTGRSPASRIEPDGGDAHFVSEPDAFLGVLDVFFAGCGIGRDEVLVNGKANQVDPVQKGMALELAQIGGVLAIHLAVKDIDPGNSESGGFLDHLLDGDLGRPEVPIGIT